MGGAPPVPVMILVFNFMCIFVSVFYFMFMYMQILIMLSFDVIKDDNCTPPFWPGVQGVHRLNFGQ